MVWEETPFFTERERAALAWTEAVTLVGQGHVPDDIYQLARGSFSENELVNLTLAIIRHQRMEPIGDQFSHPTWVLQPARQNNVRTRGHGSPAQKEGEKHAAET